MSHDAAVLRAIYKESAGAWRRLYWRRLVPGDKSMPLCARVEFDGEVAQVELLPALDHPTHGVTVILHPGVRLYCGQRRPLEDARRHAYRAAVNAIASRWMRRGVPAQDAITRYGHRIWAGRGPGLQVLLGRWLRSAAGTLRFTSDLRDFYEVRDELQLWDFAPLAASSGGIIKDWHAPQRDS